MNPRETQELESVASFAEGRGSDIGNCVNAAKKGCEWDDSI
jgi:hypothetical protein